MTMYDEHNEQLLLNIVQRCVHAML